MKILIVDDEMVSREKMKILLKNMGHETITAENGKAGLEMWSKESPSMVITDWMMPEMNGIELCQRIRENESFVYTYLVMVTSREGTDDIVTGMRAGADDFITKPFAKDELAVRIRAGERIISNQTRDVVIFALAKLAESRDEDTGGHLERIRYYSKAVGEALTSFSDAPTELNEKLIDNIFHTSPLHDIGKIGIPDYILLKPGRLDDAEFEYMKQHSKIGFETLNEALQRYPNAEYLKVSAEIARSHHEKYDGSGYPDGLVAEKIPLSARIVALADVYDALVSKRIYKDSFSHDTAKNIILEERGRHFDPKVVDAFLKCEEQFIEIHKKFEGM